MFSSIGLWYTFKQCFNCLNYEIRRQPNIYQWGTDRIKVSLSFDSVGAYVFLHKMYSLCRAQRYYGIYLSVSAISIFTLLFMKKLGSSLSQELGWQPTAEWAVPGRRTSPPLNQRTRIYSASPRGQREGRSRLPGSLARKVRVNLGVDPTILFSLYIYYSSKLGMTYSSGPCALNYTSIGFKIQGSLNFSDKWCSFTATNELGIRIHTHTQQMMRWSTGEIRKEYLFPLKSNRNTVFFT